MNATAQRPRVVSGMRPTGKLHLGHLVGALNNWAPLQEKYDCFYFVADWHALTSEYANTKWITTNAIDNVADWISAGVDPERSTLFIQSLVPEHAELTLLLSMDFEPLHTFLAGEFLEHRPALLEFLLDRFQTLDQRIISINWCHCTFSFPRVHLNVTPSPNFHSKATQSPPSVMMTRRVVPIRAATLVQ